MSTFRVKYESTRMIFTSLMEAREAQASAIEIGHYLKKRTASPSVLGSELTIVGYARNHSIGAMIGAMNYDT